MNLSDKRGIKRTQFGNIEQGELFQVGDSFYMRTSRCALNDGTVVNAVDVINGHLETVFYTDDVVKVDAEVVVK